ncbi:MAG TPA: RNA-binding protein [Nitrospiraceae bacterium]|nr:RNA-binding protein [Nitrospiraceae bacterium]
MRLDLFLKISRLVKRRAVARTLCDAGKVLVNGQSARPARAVRPGDRLTLQFPSRSIELEVLAIPAAARKPGAGEEPYRITQEKQISGESDL